MTIETKTCPTCKRELSLDSFHRSGNRYAKQGLQFRCKMCVKKRQQEPEQIRRHRDRHLARHYGLSIEDYERMFREQDGRCAICRQKPSRRLVVDHDHETDAIRGLLCIPCNVALGAFEFEGRLLAALQYLSKYTS